MESIAYILVVTLALGTIFFAIAFREPPRISTKKEEK
jgi:photosystem II PsbT protein